MMKNILYSATRQWNPGDEFILMGVESLMQEVLGDHNSILYNRNPQTRPSFGVLRAHKVSRFLLKLLYKKMISKGGFLENSFKPNSSGRYLDYIVFAGSPEWRGKNLNELYKLISVSNIPTLFLGLGAMNKIDVAKFSKNELSGLKNNVVLICRDSNCEQALKSFGSIYLPCPALFSSPFIKKVEKVKKVALLYGTHLAADANNISKETDIFMKSVYQNLLDKYSKEYDFEFVSHYIDELDQFNTDYPNRVLRYNYKSDAYLDIFKEYDLVIGHRVHGIGMCASMGIPGIMIAHDKRAETVKGFLAEMVYIDSTYDEFEKIFIHTIENVRLKSENLLAHKISIRKKYIDILSAALS